MSDKKRIIRITWDSGLQVSKGDEVEILRGIVFNEDNIRASLMKNITSGREERSSIEGVLDTRMPTDIVPPIKGIVQEIEARSNETKFDIVVGVGVIEVGLGRLLKEASKFLDKDIVEKCIHKKDAEDIVTSAFRILEERIRAKIGASHECHGADLMKEAYHPKTGKLVFGKTEAEREGLFHLFRSSILFLRNPPSHRFIREYSEFEIFEMVSLVNLLLNILEKSQVRVEQPKKPETTVKKPSQKLEKRAWKKEHLIGVVEQVYGHLHRQVKWIVWSLEKKHYRNVNFEEWGQFQEDHRYFMVDEKFRTELDEFFERVRAYNGAIIRFENTILPRIVNEETKRVFNVDTDEHVRLQVKGVKGHRPYSGTPNIIRCLISQTHPKDEFLRDESEISSIECYVNIKQRNGETFHSHGLSKFDEFWELCIARMMKDKTYNFVIEENDKLLEKARKIKKGITKRIQEQLGT